MPMTSGRVPAASRTPGRPPGANLALWLRADLGLTTNGITFTAPNDLSNPAWFPTGSSAVANATTDPVSGTNASSLVEDASNGFHYILNIFSGWVTGRVTTLSVYAKAGARNWFLLSGNGANDGSFFDVTNGVMGNTTGTILSKSMRAVGGGWFLCSITLVTTAANFWLSLATGNGVSFPSYAGNGTGNTYFYGAAALQTKVSVWADQSGHGRDVVQASAANQPLLLSTGANGAPTVAFDGSDDYMASVSFTLPQPYGVWMVANVTAQSPSSNKDVVWATGTNGSFWLIDTTPRTFLFAGASVVLPYLLGDGVYVDLAALVDGANSVIRADGAPMTTGNAGSNPGTGIFSLGGFIGSHQAKVEIAELIILTNPTVTDVSAVETYLQDRYNLRPLPFVPTMLPGCVCWLRGDLGITLNGGNVAAWADQSGNGNNAVQATAGNQPAYSATGYDGLPCVDWGTGAGGRDLVVASLSLGLYTMVGAIRADAVSGYFLVHNSDTTNGSYIYGIANNAFNINGAGVDSGYNVVANWLSDGVRRTVSVNYGGTHATHFSWRNGTPDVDVSTNAGEPGSGVATGPLYLGNSQANTGLYKGVMAEVIVYNRSLSAQELTLVHTYLKSRYGL
jgi:hypothetical protein